MDLALVLSRHASRTVLGAALVVGLASMAGCGLNSGGGGGSGGSAPVQLSLVPTQGDGQTGAVGKPLAQPLVVVARDQFSHAVMGVHVSFQVASGGGALTDTIAVTDSRGQASTLLTLGPAPGANTVVVTSGSAKATFTATGAQAGGPTPVYGLSMFVGGFPSRVVVGQSATLVVTVRDASGAVFTSYRGTVHISSDDPMATLPADYTFGPGDMGSHGFTVALNSFGLFSITATDVAGPSLSGTQGPIASGAGQATHLVVSGLPSSYSQGAPSDLVVTAADANGYTDPFYTGTVSIAATDSSTNAVLPGTFTFAQADAGVRKFPLAVRLQSTGTQTITVSELGNPSFMGSQTVNVGPALRVTSFKAAKAKVMIKGTDKLSWTLNSIPATLALAGSGLASPKIELNATSGSDTPAAPFATPPAGIDPRAWYRLTATNAGSPSESVEVTQAASAGASDGAANAVAAFEDGSYVVAGSFSGSALLGATQLTSTGGPTFGTGASSSLTSAGGKDAFLACYKADGTLAWVASAGGTADDVATAIAGFPDGTVSVAGHFSGTATFATGLTLTSTTEAVFVARYSPLGKPIWAQRVSGTGDAFAFGVAASPDGRTIVAGSFTGTATFGSLPPITSGSSGTAADAFAASFNTDGSASWVSQGSASTSKGAAGLAATVLRDGSTVVAGRFEGTATFGATTLASAGGTDAFVARYDGKGALVWAMSAGGTGDDAGAAVAAFADHTIAVSGCFQGTASFGASAATSKGGKDGFVVRLDSLGAPLWFQQISGTAEESVNGVAALGDGSAVVAGSFGSTATIGPGCTLSASGAKDGFAAKLAPVNYQMLKLKPTGFSFAAGSMHTSVGVYPNTYGYLPDVTCVSQCKDGSSIATGSFTVGGPRFDPSAALSPVPASTGYLAGRPSPYQSNFTQFVVKYGSDGSVAWAASPAVVTTASVNLRAGAVATLQDGGCITTGFQTGSVPTTINWAPTVSTTGTTGIYVVRYDAKGTATQARFFAVASLRNLGYVTYPGLGLCAFGDGSCAITGSTTATATFDGISATPAGYDVVFVTRLKPDFTTDWVTQIASSKGYCDTGGANSLATLPDGGMVTTGEYYSSLGAGTTATITDPTGTTTDFSDSTMPSGVSNGYLLKLAGDGSVKWVKTTTYGAKSGSSYVDVYAGVSAAPDGGCAVHGTFYGTMTFGSGETNATTLAGSTILQPYTVKYDADGKVVWAKSGTSTGTTVGYGVACMNDGAVVVSGYQFGTTTFATGTAISTNCYVVRYESDGKVGWGRGFTSSSNSGTTPYPHMAANADSSLVLVSKYTGSTTTLGGGTGDGYSQLLPPGYYTELMIQKLFNY
ncbi:hypothetical protein HY251_01525 [bacterium]|nr:hypothetical protein [bacterium]